MQRVAASDCLITVLPRRISSRMLTYPRPFITGSDAEVHLCLSCDVSAHSFLLTNWGQVYATSDYDQAPRSRTGGPERYHQRQNTLWNMKVSNIY
jgi:hypothetical protein